MEKPPKTVHNNRKYIQITGWVMEAARIGAPEVISKNPQMSDLNTILIDVLAIKPENIVKQIT